MNDLASAINEITDEYMQETLGQAKAYTLRAQGTLPIVCPVGDDSEWAGIGIFDAGAEEVTRIMDDDPGVQAGLFAYELHPVRGFPGSSLP